MAACLTALKPKHAKLLGLCLLLCFLTSLHAARNTAGDAIFECHLHRMREVSRDYIASCHATLDLHAWISSLTSASLQHLDHHTGQ